MSFLLLSLLLSDPAATPALIDPALLTVTDIDGQTHDAADHEAVVVVFLKPGCPIANYYHPTMRKLAAEWGDEVLLVQVHATATTTKEAARLHREEYDVAGVVAVDPEQTLARALDAKITPEAFVISPGGQVHYRGRVDDMYIGFGRRRQVVTDETLKNAVAAVRDGKPIAIAKTTPIGCRIHYPAK